MGSGASTLTPPSSPELDDYDNYYGSKMGSSSHLKGNAQNARCLVRTNEVAPIIIRDCREEFQHVSDFKEPIVYGSIADNMPEHPLIKGKYFLVRDVTDKVDKNKSYEQYRAPNFHKAKGFPVYSSGQPTERGLVTLLDKLAHDSFTEILLFNLREEPVLFVSNGNDMIPHSIRDQDDLQSCVIVGRMPTEADEAEARVRKEVIDLATIKEENRFYFYKDLDNLHREPHEMHVQYEDHLLVSEEVYARHVLCTHGVKYQRLCFPLQSAPTDQDVDLFLDMFKDCPRFFEPEQQSKIALLFTCQTGIGRSTVGMVMGCLVLAHKRGFEISNSSKMDRMSSFERGEYMAVQELVSLLPSGKTIKAQVDSVIDQCSHFCNIRAEIWEAKHFLEGIKKDYILEGKKAKETTYKRCCDFLQRYIFLISFNAYLTEQYPLWFTTKFSKWMQRQPEINRIRGTVSHACRLAPLDLIFTDEQYLVADDYIGLDVLSTQMDVRVSNFRKINIKGFSVYGMAQPARDGATKVSNHLLSKKQGHTFLVLVNLRNDCVIECDGATYSIRDSTCLDEPIIHPGIRRREIEEKEEMLKKEIRSKKSVQVYNELSDPPVQREMTSILTTAEIADQQKLQTLDMQYYRIPLRYDNIPQERDFDEIMALITEHYVNEKPKSNTACVFYCRTGKSRTTFALAVSGLVMCHIKGFPKGSNVGEQERVSCPNAQYTKGDFMIVQKLIRLLPNGQQIKREVDFVLDECFETMSPMHFHIREVIFVTYNKIKHAKNENERQNLKRQSLDFLERYLYLILFNCYLHHDKNIKWQRKFSVWMKQVAVHVGVYELLDNLGFYDFEKVPTAYKTMRERWRNRTQQIPFHGIFT